MLTRPLSCPVSARLSCLSVCDVGLLRGQDETWHAGRLRPGHIVLDGDPALPQRGADPNFRPISVVAKWLDGSRCHLVQRWASAKATLPHKNGPCLLWPNGWMDQDDTWHGGRPHYARWGQSSPTHKVDRAPFNSRPMSVVAKQLCGSR